MNISFLLQILSEADTRRIYRGFKLRPTPDLPLICSPARMLKLNIYGYVDNAR
jgi:hypothetical protein